MKELGKTLCEKWLVYGARGVITIIDHLQRKSHVEKYILKKKNFSLPGQSTFGLHPIYKEFMLLEKTLPVNSNIPLSDCITHMEGMVLSFTTDYSLPFSSAWNIVELPKEMMRDSKAANKLQVARQTASKKNAAWLSQRTGKVVNRQTERSVFQF